MVVHRGPAATPDENSPDQLLIAAVDDAAVTLLLAWDEARERVTPRLSWPQLNALLALERAEGQNLGGLAADLRMLLSSASRLCDRLVASGLVERVPGTADRREIALYLTPGSRALLAELRRVRRAAVTGILSRMSAPGRAALLRGLAEFSAAGEQGGQAPARSA